jgi:hypothetical protein
MMGKINEITAGVMHKTGTVRCNSAFYTEKYNNTIMIKFMSTKSSYLSVMI